MSTTAVTWPTVAEIRDTHDILSQGLEALEELAGRLEMLVDVSIAPSIIEEAETPTIEMLGALVRCIAILKLDSETIRGRVRVLAEIRDCIAIDDKLAMLEGGDDA